MNTANKIPPHKQGKSALNSAESTVDQHRGGGRSPNETAMPVNGGGEHEGLHYQFSSGTPPPQMLHLVADIAIGGLPRAGLSPEEYADFCQGLSALLPPAAAEAALYTATCIRETRRAHREMAVAIKGLKRKGKQ